MEDLIKILEVLVWPLAVTAILSPIAAGLGHVLQTLGGWINWQVQKEQ